MSKQIENVTILSASATLKAAAAYKGTKARNRRDAIIQVYMSSAYNYVETSDVKHLNNIVEVAKDNGQVRAAQSLVKAVAFHAFDKEKGAYKEGKLTKVQKQKRDKIHEKVDDIIGAWIRGENKNTERAFNPDTRFHSLIKGMMEKAGMSAEEVKEYINGKLDAEIANVAKLDA